MTRSIVPIAARALAAVAFVVPFARQAHARADDPEAVPVCVNNGPYVGECTGQSTAVPVTSAGSFDPDGSDITVQWFEECPHGFFDDPTAPDSNMVIDLLGTCSKTCVFELRIFSGGQVTKCNSTVTVQDTTPPVITCPPDFVEIWNGGIPAGQVDPTLTGFATAVDCDPAPIIAYTDVNVPNTMAGQPELVVTRTWTATDYCDLQSSCVQTITLLSPTAGLGAVLDLRPGNCPNEVSVGSEGVLTMVIFGTSSFDASQIDRSTLALRRMNNGGTAVTRSNSRLLDKGRPGNSANPSCSSASLDGRADLQLTFSLQQVRDSLGLAADAPNGVVEFAITGRMVDGRYFTVRDVATIVD